MLPVCVRQQQTIQWVTNVSQITGEQLTSFSHSLTRTIHANRWTPSSLSAKWRPRLYLSSVSSLSLSLPSLAFHQCNHACHQPLEQVTTLQFIQAIPLFFLLLLLFYTRRGWMAIVTGWSSPLSLSLSLSLWLLSLHWALSSVSPDPRAKSHHSWLMIHFILFFLSFFTLVNYCCLSCVLSLALSSVVSSDARSLSFHRAEWCSPCLSYS